MATGGLIMRTTALLLGCLTFGLINTASGEGQTQLSSPKEAIANQFWGELYASGGSTLYCGKSFEAGDSSVTASPIYSTKQLKSAMRCITDRQCTIMNPKYPYIVSDLHNYYPALELVDQARRNAQFDVVEGNASNKFANINCAFKTGFQTAEPRDEVKGNVARALFYMHVEYELPLPTNTATLKRWNQMDLPDLEEKSRNDRIAALQGTRNRFIDNPALADQLITE